MVNGAVLAAIAKDTPQAIDPDEVRMAGYIIERYSSLLECLVAMRVTGGGVMLTFDVSTEHWRDIAYDAFGGE